MSRPTIPGLPKPPNLDQVRRRLLRGPATLQVLAEDLDCLHDQVAVVLEGFECFVRIERDWSTVWALRTDEQVDPPMLSEAPQWVLLGATIALSCATGAAYLFALVARSL